MGEAIWLYLWLLDKMTSVNENGIGKVMGNAPITHEQITTDLGIHRNTYVKYVKKLRDAGYIHTLRTPYGLIITVNKAEKIFGKKSSTRTRASKKLSDAPKRVQLSKSDAHEKVHKMHTNVSPDAHERVQTNKTIQDNTVDNTSNTNVLAEPAKPVRYGKPEINDMFDFWSREVGYDIESKVTANRRACSNLVKKYGKEKLEQLIRGVAIAQSDQYAPRISDFSELQSKANQLVAWGKTKMHADISAKGVVL